jgi:hypothetical protein
MHGTTRTIVAKVHAVAIPAPGNTSVFEHREFTLVIAALLLPIVLIAGTCVVVCHCLQ